MDWRGQEWTQFQHTAKGGYPPALQITLYIDVVPTQRKGRMRSLRAKSFLRNIVIGLFETCFFCICVEISRFGGAGTFLSP